MHLSEQSARVLFLVASVVSIVLPGGAQGVEPKTLCYSVQPNGYLDDRAADVAKIYDGFFFQGGSWEEAAERLADRSAPATPHGEWREKVRKNLASLTAAGVTENFLTVHFSDSGWPSKSTLLTGAFADSMAERFGAIAKAARELGFRGVCIDGENCYRRCDVTHPSYTYDDYTVGDLIAAARREGRQSMAAMLEAFPEIVILILPGYLRGRPLEREYLLGLMEEMASRDAPGGFHLGTEYTYCLHDPVTALATTRFEDPWIPLLGDARVADYWKRRCTVAPGVWPLHMVETGGQDYPLQPWKKEIAELRQQMAILRTVAKRFIWSFTGQPSWYLYSPSLGQKYGLSNQDLKRPDIDLRLWHDVLQEKPTLPADSPLRRLVAKTLEYDRGQITGEELCDVMGTPGRWWVLGPVGNPHTERRFSALECLGQPIDPHTPYHGRSGVVRWFAYPNLDPRGVVSCTFLLAKPHTDTPAPPFLTNGQYPQPREGEFEVGWGHGIVVRQGDQVVFDRAKYPANGKGMLFRDKHQFEARVPITIEEGDSRLSVSSINSHGSWVFSLRITDNDDLPISGLQFRLE